MRLVIVGAVLYVCSSSVHCQLLPTNSCQLAPDTGIKGEPSTKTSSEGSCFAPSPPGTPGNHPPRYSRSILTANKRASGNSNVGKLRLPREVNAGERYQGDSHDEQQNNYSPPRNFVYRPARHDLREQDFGSSQQKLPLRQLYPINEALVPPTSRQGQYSPSNLNQANPPTHAFGVRICPFCNNHLPPEPVYQQQMLNPRYSQFQPNPQLQSQFNKPQQYSMLQGQVGYPNINAAVKTTPTVQSEEMCPYNSGGPEWEPRSSPGSEFNQTLQQAPDIRGPPGIPPPPPYLVSKNFQPYTHSQITPKAVKGIPAEQSFKYLKTQKTEGLPINMSGNTG